MGFSGTDAGGFHWEGFNSGAPSQQRRRQHKPRKPMGSVQRTVVNVLCVIGVVGISLCLLMGILWG